jgi:hypothetical protein
MSSEIASPQTPDSSIAPPAESSLDVLTDLEVRIARRADQIAAVQPACPGSNLFCWLAAEQEILATADYLDRPLVGMS